VVNLTHGTFVCLACSGVHREYSHRMKGIGASSFVEEEVEKLYGNEAVNSRYMAKYDESKERVKAPDNNRDLQLLRVFIRRKYIEKAWYKNDDQKNEPFVATGPTRVKIPPQNKSDPTTTTSSAKLAIPEDLLSFDAPTTDTRQEDSWDAFGNAKNHFHAAFEESSVAIQQDQQQPHKLFQPDFSSLQQQDNADFSKFGNNTATSLPQWQQQLPVNVPQGVMSYPSENANQNSSVPHVNFQQPTPFAAFQAQFDQNSVTNLTSAFTTSFANAGYGQQQQPQLTAHIHGDGNSIAIASMNHHAVSSLAQAVHPHPVSPQSYGKYTTAAMMQAPTARIPSLPPVGPPPDESPPDPPESPQADDDDDFPPPRHGFSGDDFSPLSSDLKVKEQEIVEDDFPTLSSSVGFSNLEEPSSFSVAPTTNAAPIIQVNAEKKNVFDAFASLSLRPSTEHQQSSDYHPQTTVASPATSKNHFALGQEVIFNNGGVAVRMKIVNMDDGNNYTVCMNARKEDLFSVEEYQDQDDNTAIVVSKADYSLMEKVKQLPQDKKMLIEKFINAL
jgi:hypothetical protein